MKKNTIPLMCHCGSTSSYLQCCGRFIDDGEIPATAEQLMRSRYTAYVRENDDYLHATWHVSTRPPEKLTQPGLKWLGLEVRQHLANGDQATVEFVARHRLGAKSYRLHEVSRFVREQGRWFYLDGSFPKGK